MKKRSIKQNEMNLNKKKKIEIINFLSMQGFHL